MKKELLLGCGSSRRKLMGLDSLEWEGLVTLDINPAHAPDILHDLNYLPLPFADETFDEIHAYEVLEHLGGQGDYHSFFSLFTELHRITKKGGYLYATVPRWDSQWAWGDPSHKRVITKGTLAFLDQNAYNEQVGKTAMSDFRYIYKVSWTLKWDKTDGESYMFILEKG